MRSRIGILPGNARGRPAPLPPGLASANSSSRTARVPGRHGSCGTARRWCRPSTAAAAPATGILMDGIPRGSRWRRDSGAQRRRVASVDDVVAPGTHQRLGALGVGEDVEAVPGALHRRQRRPPRRATGSGRTNRERRRWRESPAPSISADRPPDPPSSSASGSGRLRWDSKMFVITSPGQRTDTPISAPARRRSRCQGLAQSDHAVLGDVVGAEVGHRDETGHGCGVDHVRRAALLEHEGHEHTDPVDDAPQVDAEHPLPVPLGVGPDRSAHTDAGVVVDEVHGAELGHGGVCERLDGVPVGHVGAHADDPATGPGPGRRRWRRARPAGCRRPRRACRRRRAGWPPLDRSRSRRRSPPRPALRAAPCLRLLLGSGRGLPAVEDRRPALGVGGDALAGIVGGEQADLLGQLVIGGGPQPVEAIASERALDRLAPPAALTRRSRLPARGCVHAPLPTSATHSSARPIAAASLPSIRAPV